MIAWAPFAGVGRLTELFAGIDGQLQGLPAKILSDQVVQDIETRLHQYVDEHCEPKVPAP